MIYHLGKGMFKFHGDPSNSLVNNMTIPAANLAKKQRSLNHLHFYDLEIVVAEHLMSHTCPLSPSHFFRSD